MLGVRVSPPAPVTPTDYTNLIPFKLLNCANFATIHPDIKRTLVDMSERTGLSVSQVTDEVLYTGLVGMQEIDEL